VAHASDQARAARRDEHEEQAMLIAAQIVAGLAALLHIVFFLFESVFWSRPRVFGRFGIATQAEADTIRPMAYNQGFYNLALAVGVIVGIVLLGGAGGGADGAAGGAGVAGKAVMIFGTACMSLAGLVLASTGRHYRSAAAIQFVPAVVALILTSLVPA
jgi:putative membrane protein